ncbi:hypothetical protein TBLA_0H01530 [Henningerozyma blattae CBS 6284]|uniref:Mediator of RNA polymerase II transcription subunit 1 n=1 Tax=Henningerozyma blattae (strain ATCC 34711 / CBS 6284 / DSM 70876 / NBRC 10599 / NRRL Y-10934 / UCD 77-7) TaxID=1071380 RepID=I2H7T8_HENB6|nr:hypothetical protein TBLA_0H01530 [Tetrapisispora blattae CBS 6284]CCH62440.1 hypothetical protein TBLA_0H01530 [Tetrapisispora blattae CBS 6284]
MAVDLYVETLKKMIEKFQEYKPGSVTLDNITKLCQTLGLESFIDDIGNGVSRLSTASKIIVIDIDFDKIEGKVKDVKLVLASNFDNFNYYNTNIEHKAMDSTTNNNSANDNDDDKSKNILFNSLSEYSTLHEFHHNLQYLYLLDSFSQIEVDPLNSSSVGTGSNTAGTSTNNTNGNSNGHNHNNHVNNHNSNNSSNNTNNDGISSVGNMSSGGTSMISSQGKLDLFKYYTELSQFIDEYFVANNAPFSIATNLNNMFGIYISISGESKPLARIYLEKSRDPQQYFYEYTFSQSSNYWINEHSDSYTMGISLVLEIIDDSSCIFPLDLIPRDLIIELGDNLSNSHNTSNTNSHSNNTNSNYIQTSSSTTNSSSSSSGFSRSSSNQIESNSLFTKMNSMTNLNQHAHKLSNSNSNSNSNCPTVTSSNSNTNQNQSSKNNSNNINSYNKNANTQALSVLDNGSIRSVINIPSYSRKSKFQIMNDFTTKMINIKKFDISNDNLSLILEFLRWVRWSKIILNPVIKLISQSDDTNNVTTSNGNQNSSVNEISSENNNNNSNNNNNPSHFPSRDNLEQAHELPINSNQIHSSLSSNAGELYPHSMSVSNGKRRRSSNKSKRPSLTEASILKDEGFQQFNLHEIMTESVIEEENMVFDHMDSFSSPKISSSFNDVSTFVDEALGNNTNAIANNSGKIEFPIKTNNNYAPEKLYKTASPKYLIISEDCVAIDKGISCNIYDDVEKWKIFIDTFISHF